MTSRAMTTPTITVTISSDGELRVGVQGAAGPSCRELTRSLETALGVTTEDVTTPEYYQRTTPAGRYVRLDSA
jgi:hypothetical protein